MSTKNPPGWVDSIYQIKPTDRVQGGPNGVINTAPMQLAQRTDALKVNLDFTATFSGDGLQYVGTFADGFTLSNVSQVLGHSDGNFYVWHGHFSKVVPPDSTPESTGGIGNDTWVDIRNLTLRSSLASPGGVRLVKGATDVDEVEKYLLGGGIFCGVFFASNESPYINLVMSNDGLRFGDPIRLAYADSPMAGRDPCIINFKNRWIISRTSYTVGVHDFGLYVSDDLLNWKNITCKMGDVAVCSNTTPAPGGTVPADRIWAPELVEHDGELYVFISIRAHPDELDINGQSIPSFRAYVSKCLDFDNLKFSVPFYIDMQPGNKIDPDVIYDESISKFVMVIKDETDKSLEVHTAASLYGPYSYLTDITLGEPVEGPSIVKLSNGRKRIYFDPFTTKTGIQYVETSDWVNYGITQAVDMARMRHGSVSNVNFDGNKFYDVIKLSGLGSSRSEVQTQTQFVVLAAGTRTIAPAEDTVYCTSGSSAVEINLLKGAARFAVCVRSNNNFAGIKFSGLVFTNYKVGFGKDKDVIIEFKFDPPVGKYRIINFTRIPAPNSLVASAGTTEVNQGEVKWSPDYGATYTTVGSDGNEVVIHDLPTAPADGFYFNLMVRSAVARGAIRLKSGGNMGNPTDIVLYGPSGADGRLIRVEKVGGKWYVSGFSTNTALEGRVMYFAGDSITLGSPGASYVPALVNQLGGTLGANVAVGGQKMVHIPTQLASLTIPTNAALFIWIGTNDFGGNTALGVEADGGSSAASTFYRHCQLAAEAVEGKIQDDTLVYFISPLARKANTVNTAGNSLSNFANAIQFMCRAFGFGFIDGASVSQFNTKNMNLYTADGLHPNAAGASFIATRLSKYLRNNG